MNRVRFGSILVLLVAGLATSTYAQTPKAPKALPVGMELTIYGILPEREMTVADMAKLGLTPVVVKEDTPVNNYSHKLGTFFSDVIKKGDTVAATAAGVWVYKVSCSNRIAKIVDCPKCGQATTPAKTDTGAGTGGTATGLMAPPAGADGFTKFWNSFWNSWIPWFLFWLALILLALGWLLPWLLNVYRNRRQPANGGVLPLVAGTTAAPMPLSAVAILLGRARGQVVGVHSVTDCDFVEVHKRTGETFSMNVTHDSAIMPNQHGVGIDGQAIVLTSAATQAARRNHQARRAAAGL